MANERITEEIVREHFRGDPDVKRVAIEEQASLDPVIARALKIASKQGTGTGRPEFIVRLPEEAPEEVILVECKAETKSHESPRHKNGEQITPADVVAFAVDGVLHYAKHLSKHRNVIAVAVSGSSKSKLRVSTYRHIKGAQHPQLLMGRDGTPVERLRTVADYIELFRYDPAVILLTTERLASYSRRVHNFLRAYGKVTEAEKPLVISAILLALQYAPFRASWSVTDDQNLAKSVIEAIEKSVRKAITSSARRDLMMAAYSFLPMHPDLTKAAPLRPDGMPHSDASPLRYLIDSIEHEILPFAAAYPHVDVVGQFYAEFLRYTGGDGSGLGVVLTPRHLTELFVQVAQIGKNDVVIDPCAGTGGFLISAMAEMDRQARDDETVKARIRETQLIGIEQISSMFALCVSNMVLRGDGRSNLHRGDCLDQKLQRDIITPARAGLRRPNKGLINPPYGQEQHELYFVGAMMEMLAKDGIGVAVVPMSCAIAPHEARGRLLASHTLVAAMSLPDELFYPVGAIACALVLRAHTPHEEAGTKTWFGYWKDDGLVKVKHLGRMDLEHRWDGIRKGWIDDFRNTAEAPGRCIKRRVTADDEWCAEAYLKTDYSTLKKEDFERVVREYALFVLGQQTGEPPDAENQ